MTPLRQRMVNDITVRGLAENTMKPYLSSVSGLACHYGRSPDRISAQEVQDYLMFLHDERGLTWQSCNSARHGIRFFYRITLGLPEPHRTPNSRQCGAGLAEGNAIDIIQSASCEPGGKKAWAIDYALPRSASALQCWQAMPARR